MAKKETVNWNSFTKAELIKTIKKLSAREASLLNRIAKMECAQDTLAGHAAALVKDTIVKAGRKAEGAPKSLGELARECTPTDEVVVVEVGPLPPRMPWDDALPNGFAEGSGK